MKRDECADHQPGRKALSDGFVSVGVSYVDILAQRFCQCGVRSRIVSGTISPTAEQKCLQHSKCASVMQLIQTWD
jgi:hypothetical protein